MEKNPGDKPQIIQFYEAQEIRPELKQLLFWFLHPLSLSPMYGRSDAAPLAPTTLPESSWPPLGSGTEQKLTVSVMPAVGQAGCFPNFQTSPDSLSLLVLDLLLQAQPGSEHLGFWTLDVIDS